MTQTELDKYKKMLEAKQAELENTLRETGKISGMGEGAPVSDIKATTAKLEEAFRDMGLPADQAAIAARGR